MALGAVPEMGLGGVMVAPGTHPMAHARSVVEDEAVSMKATTRQGDRRTNGRTTTKPHARSLEPRGLQGSRPRSSRKTSRQHLRRRGIVVAVLALVAVGAFALTRPDPEPPTPEEIRGSSSWATEHYGDPTASGYLTRNITTIDFLGRPMQVHKKAARHFLRLARLFAARAPEYAATMALGELDDWSYENRIIRGETTDRSNHAFGLAIDINALANVLGSAGDMPAEVVAQWELEGGDWGGDWSRPDPMHFETHLTPSEIRARYRPDGTPKDWYLEELVGG